MVKYLLPLLLKLALLYFIYIFFLGTTYYDFHRTYTMKNWSQIQGQVKRVFISQDTANQYVSKKYISTFVSYTYTVKGKLFSNVDLTTYKKLYQSSTSNETITEMEKKFYGTKVKVYYDPAHPENASIVEPKMAEAIGMWASIGVMLEIVILLWIFRPLKTMLQKKP